jgi:hypothetical protein
VNASQLTVGTVLAAARLVPTVQCTSCPEGKASKQSSTSIGDCFDVDKVQVVDLTYQTQGIGIVDDGVADVCLHPSECYIVTTQGPDTAHWALHDESGIVVVEGSAPSTHRICHCGHNGGPACLSCTDVAAPAGGTLGDCSADGVLDHGSTCLATCSGSSEVQPMSCWNGTLASSSNCCEPGMMWDGEVGSACVSCVAGRYDHDSSPHTSCTGCEAGFYSGGVGATSCSVCPIGQSSASGSAECTSCAPGSYDSRSVDNPDCADDPDWTSQHGGCETYAPGGANALHCESDGAMEACPVACGLCAGASAGCARCRAGRYAA